MRRRLHAWRSDAQVLQRQVVPVLLDGGLGERGELLVRGLLFVEILAEQLVDLIVAQHLRVGADGAVGGDLVVLDLLRRRDEGHIHHG